MRTGWFFLVILLALAAGAACGPPEITDISENPVGDDDDDAATTNPTGSPTGPTNTPTPGGSPVGTLPPGVPSFATWQSQIRANAPASCNACHSGGSGGWSYISNDTSISNQKYYWFTSLCNRNFMGNNSGVQVYNPPTGRLRATMCNQNGNHPVNVPAGMCAIADNWLNDGTITPPDCNTTYDLDNSQ